MVRDASKKRAKGDAMKVLAYHVILFTHPFANQRTPNGRLPSAWGQDFRKVYLFTPAEIRQRIRYVEDNPVKEGKARQRWSFVVPTSNELSFLLRRRFEEAC